MKWEIVYFSTQQVLEVVQEEVLYILSENVGPFLAQVTPLIY